LKSETLRLPYRAPYDWAATLAFLSRRAITGVEQVDGRVYRRTVRHAADAGAIEVGHGDDGAGLVVTIQGLPVATTEAVAGRLRRMFDLDADLPLITAHLARDPWIAPHVAARPALRVFGGWDGFEVAARSIMGQQVTVERARHLNGVLVDRCGRVNGDPADGVYKLFPTAQEVLDADLSSMGMPGARASTLKAVAAALIADPHLFDRSDSVDVTVERLRAIRGIGDWTAHYIAMRACREPDAFPASDVGLLRGAAGATGRRPAPAELLSRAEAWRPWRAYAAHHLWAVDPG
jgi:AraC family transcriptional regulator of adaptative response / DNA-3-methyladenine glycosylase II